MRPATSSSVPDPARAPIAALLARYLDSLIAGDRRGALRLVTDEGLGQGLSVPLLQAEVVQAAQREIGRLWQRNEISIAQEHMATAISHVVLARLFEEATAAERLGHRVVVACVQGERHEFPARLVSDYLELGGFDVRFLGADLPADDLMTLLRNDTPDLLALSVTMSFNAASLVATVRRVRLAYPRLPILVGGHALAWEPGLATRCGVESAGMDAESLVATARRLVERKPS